MPTSFSHVFCRLSPDVLHFLCSSCVREGLMTCERRDSKVYGWWTQEYEEFVESCLSTLTKEFHV